MLLSPTTSPVEVLYGCSAGSWQFAYCRTNSSQCVMLSCPAIGPNVSVQIALKHPLCVCLIAYAGVKPLVVERTAVAAAASGKAGGFLARGWGARQSVPKQSIAHRSRDRQRDPLVLPLRRLISFERSQVVFNDTPKHTFPPPASSIGDGSVTQELHQKSFDLHAELAVKLGVESYRRIPTLQVAGGKARKAGITPPASWLDGSLARVSMMDPVTAQVATRQPHPQRKTGALAPSLSRSATQRCAGRLAPARTLSRQQRLTAPAHRVLSAAAGDAPRAHHQAHGCGDCRGRPPPDRCGPRPTSPSYNLILARSSLSCPSFCAIKRAVSNDSSEMPTLPVFANQAHHHLQPPFLSGLACCRRRVRNHHRRYRQRQRRPQGDRRHRRRIHYSHSQSGGRNGALECPGRGLARRVAPGPDGGGQVDEHRLFHGGLPQEGRSGALRALLRRGQQWVPHGGVPAVQRRGALRADRGATR